MSRPLAAIMAECRNKISAARKNQQGYVIKRVVVSADNLEELLDYIAFLKCGYYDDKGKPRNYDAPLP
jgi:hypothetical protein